MGDRVLELETAMRELWPHLTGHCFEGATPACFGNMRAIVSGVVRGEDGEALPYSDEATGIAPDCRYCAALAHQPSADGVHRSGCAAAPAGTGSEFLR